MVPFTEMWKERRGIFLVFVWKVVRVLSMIIFLDVWLQFLGRKEVYYNPKCIFSLHTESELCILKLLKRTRMTVSIVTWKKWKYQLLSHVWLFSDPIACSPPGSSVCGISQARILKWVAIPFFRGSSRPRDQTWVSCIAGRFFTVWATREAPHKELRTCFY